jgi:hypothetical protein
MNEMIGMGEEENEQMRKEEQMRIGKRDGKRRMEGIDQMRMKSIIYNVI